MSKASELVKHWREVGPIAWAQGVYGWIGPDGKPITLEPWQRAILAAWEASRGEISTVAISCVKKTGKTTVNAIFTAWRWLALPGTHFCSGNDFDQSAGLQFEMIGAMVRRHPYLKSAVRATGKQLTYLPTGSTVTALAVDAAGNAGANHLTVSHTEAWGIVYEAGIRAYEELTPPPGSFYGLPALRVCDSYAGYEVESKTWHGLVDRGVAGERVSEEWPIFRAGALLLFHMEGEEAQSRCFRGNSREAATYYTDQQAQLRPGAFQRYHLNHRASGEGAFVSAEQWEACRVPGLTNEGRLVLGADASTTRDLTALVGCGWNPAARRVEAVYCRTWTPKRGILRGGRPTVDLEKTIQAEILRLHQARRLSAVVYDPYQLHSIALALQRAGVRMIEMPQTVARVESDQALYDAILSGGLAHNGDSTLTEHVLNAVAVETPRGLRLAKEKAGRKIDAAVALSMAHHIARQEGEYIPLPAIQPIQKSRFISEPVRDGMSRWKRY